MSKKEQQAASQQQQQQQQQQQAQLEKSAIGDSSVRSDSGGNAAGMGDANASSTANALAGGNDRSPGGRVKHGRRALREGEHSNVPLARQGWGAESEKPTLQEPQKQQKGIDNISRLRMCCGCTVSDACRKLRSGGGRKCIRIVRAAKVC